MDFNFRIEEKKDYTVLNFSGNLIEKSQAIAMFEKFDDLLSKDVNKFVVNMSGFGYMNSTGLNTLITILTKARKAGGEAVVCCVPENIRSLLVITKLNNIFNVAATEEEAVGSLLKAVS